MLRIIPDWEMGGCVVVTNDNNFGQGGKALKTLPLPSRASPLRTHLPSASQMEFLSRNKKRKLPMDATPLLKKCKKTHSDVLQVKSAVKKMCFHGRLVGNLFGKLY